MTGSASGLLVCVALLISAAPRCIEAGVFLEPLPPAHVLLLEDLERAMGGMQRVPVEAEVQAVEEAMLPTYRALPHVGGDRLAPGAVRYILHRYFRSKRNWSVFGLGSEGASWDAASAASAFAGHSPDLEAVFERHLARGGGLTLRQAAMLAATLETLVHEESMARLRRSYRLANQSTFHSLTEQWALMVLDIFLHILIHQQDHDDSLTGPKVALTISQSYQMWPEWHKRVSWMRDLRREIVYSVGVHRSTTFETMAQVVDEVVNQFGWFTSKECADMKVDLRRFERASTGRIPLVGFYGAAVHNGTSHFHETADYMRMNGALDESNPASPSVIIPNYLAMPSNCLPSSMYFSVCCSDECEALIGHIEAEVQAPAASPALLVDIVRRLPSATVSAPRVLAAELVGRVEAISAEHGGIVPLHGRLFMQWMHAAYPLECPFPHLAGKTNPRTDLFHNERWQEAMGVPATMNQSEMRAYLGRHAAETAPQEDVETCQSWQHEEELFFEVPRARRAGLRDLFRRAAILAVVSSASLVLVRVADSARRGASGLYRAEASESKYV